METKARKLCSLSACKLTIDSIRPRCLPKKQTRFDWSQYLEEHCCTAEAYLRDNYQNYPVNDLARKLGCHRSTLLRMARKLNLPSRHKLELAGMQYKSQQALITELYLFQCPKKCISRLTGRTEAAIKKKLYRLQQDFKIPFGLDPLRCSFEHPCRACIAVKERASSDTDNDKN